MTDLYQALGVSATKDDVHSATAQMPPPAFKGAFCYLAADVHNADVIHAIHSDGAGTKANVAYIAAKERPGARRWFAGLAQDSFVMNLDDLLCVGATGPYIASNTIGRNAALIGAEVLSELIYGYRDFSTVMAGQGVQIVLGGGETADSGDTVRTLVVDSTLYTTLRRADVIDFSRVVPGDAIVGLSSQGKATYEDAVNSGIGSNGFTLARHVLLSKSYRDLYPETFSPEIDREKVYAGKYRVEDGLPGTAFSVGEALLSPTRSYAPVIKSLLLAERDCVHGLIHNTGGGLAKCLRFGSGLRFAKTDLLPMPSILKLIQAEGNVPPATLLRTFNCGHRMEVYCPADAVDTVVKLAARFGIDASRVGTVGRSSGPGNELMVRYEGEEYLFSERAPSPTG